MKWFEKRPDLTSLWEEDGDLKRMKAFFYTIEADSEGNEQIKQSVKQKALEKMAREERDGSPMTAKRGLVQRIRARLIVLSRIRRWKIGVSIVGLVVLVVIGQGVMNPSWNLFLHMGMGKSAESRQSLSIVSQSPDLNGAEGQADRKPASSNSLVTPLAKGVTTDALYTDQTVVPPADAGIPRKITHDLSLTLEVAKIDDAVGKISREVQQQGGYVAESQENNSDSLASAQITVKIPVDKLNGLRDSLATWGKVSDQHMLANDITNQYYDSQVRLQTLEAEEKRYLEILNQAKTVDDVLKVENALGNIRQQIEQLKGQLKLWNNQVDYSTVKLRLSAPQGPNVSVNNPWQPISWSQTWKATHDAVLKTISSSWNLLNYLVVGLGYALPYLLIGIIGWGVYRVWRKRKS